MIRRQELVLATVGALLVLVAATLLLIRPTRQATAEARADRDTAVAESQSLRDQIKALEALKPKEAELKAQAELAKAEFPATPALPGLVDALQDAASQAGVELGTVAPSTPEASTVNSLLAQITTTINVSGGYFEIQDFLVRLENLVKGSDPARVTPRSVLVESVNLTGGSDEQATSDSAAATSGAAASPDELEGNIVLTVFQLAQSSGSSSTPAAPPAVPLRQRLPGMGRGLRRRRPGRLDRRQPGRSPGQQPGRHDHRQRQPGRRRRNRAVHHPPWGPGAQRHHHRHPRGRHRLHLREHPDHDDEDRQRRQVAPGPAVRHLDDPGDRDRAPVHGQNRHRDRRARPGEQHRPHVDDGGLMTDRLRPARGQAGVTMVEMAVVIALLGLVLAMAMQGLISYQRATASADTRQQNLEEARNVMAVLTKDLRTANGFTAATATDVTFTALLNIGATAPPNQVRLYVDGSGVLREAVTVPDDPTASPITYTGTPATRVVGRGLTATSSLLSYRDSSDNVTATLTAITSVVVTVSVDLPSRSGTDVPATVLTSRVFLPNVAASASEE